MGFAVSNADTYLLTVAFLSMFVYMSGYFASKNSFCNLREVKYYFVKKALRIWPLFLLAGTLFLLYAKAITFEQYIKSLFGISLLFPPAPVTIWFINLMFMYWIVTPFILYKNKFRVTIILICFLLFLLFTFGGADERILLYFPSYLCGLFKGRSTPTSKSIYRLFFGIGLLIIGFLCYGSINSALIYPIKLIVFYGTGTFLVQLGILLTRSNSCVTKICEWISYASMCAYLFHRIVFSFYYNTVVHYRYHVGFAYLVILPTVFIFAYYIQLIYDKLIKLLRHHCFRTLLSMILENQHSDED